MANEMYVDNPATSGEPAYGFAARAYSAAYLKALYAPKKAWKKLRNHTADVTGFGESVSLPSLPAIAAVDVTTSTGAFTPDTTSITLASVVINKHKMIAHTVPEYLILQSKADIMAAFAERAGEGVSDSVDAELVKLFPGFSRTGGTANTDLTEALALGCIGKLVEKHAPIGNPDEFVWVLPSSQYAVVKALNGYNNYRLTGAGSADGSRDVQALIDTLYGFDVVFREDAAMTVTSGKIGGLMHRDSVGVAFQRMPSMMQPVPVANTINTQLRCYALFGIAELKDDLAVRVLCK